MAKRHLLTAGLLGLLVSGISEASEHVVIQKDKQFSKDALNVKSDDIIVFRNDDPVVHNVFSTSEALTFNVTQSPGEETRVTAGAKGEILVRCAIHPKMKLTVRVE
jgi:plastocyanin